jgi:hypothetical protein
MRIIEYADAYSYVCGIAPHKHKCPCFCSTPCNNHRKLLVTITGERKLRFTQWSIDSVKITSSNN